MKREKGDEIFHDKRLQPLANKVKRTRDKSARRGEKVRRQLIVTWTTQGGGAGSIKEREGN